MSRQNLVLFDGDCGLCRRAVAWLNTRDEGLLFFAVPYQEAPSPPMTPALFTACKQAVHLVQRDGTILKAGRAVLYMLEHTGMGRLARVLAHPPFLWLVELGYRVVARNRPFFGRFLFRPSSRNP